MFASAIPVVTAISPAAVTKAWVWSPRRTLGLGITVPVVVARCDKSGRGRSSKDWPTTGNKSSAGKARGVVKGYAAPRPAATQHAHIGACRHRTDDVVTDARPTAQIEIIGNCCCRDCARRK